MVISAAVSWKINDVSYRRMSRRRIVGFCADHFSGSALLLEKDKIILYREQLGRSARNLYRARTPRSIGPNFRSYEFPDHLRKEVNFRAYS